MNDVARQAIEALFTTLPAAVAVYHLEEPGEDRSLRLVAVNPEAERLLGAPAEALTGKLLEELCRGAPGVELGRALAQVARGGAEVAPGGAQVALGSAWSVGDEVAGARSIALRAFPLPGRCVGALLEAGAPLPPIQGGRTESEDTALENAFCRRIIDSIPDVIYAKDPRDLRYVYWNKAFAELAGLPADGVFGKSDDDFFSREAAAVIHALDREVLARGETLEVEEVVHTPTRGPRSFRTRKMPLFNAKGEPEFLAGMSTDITEHKQAEEALRRSEAELRAVQKRLIETIRELSTPVLPIHDGVLVVPLVGHMDIERAGQLMEALLGRIHRHATHTVILDVTGLPAVDAAVAGHLIQAVRAAGLLGARCVVVGISPAVAAALVELGVELGAIVTRSDLQAGVAFAVACGGRSPARGRSPG